jgi:hypothetical protein
MYLGDCLVMFRVYVILISALLDQRCQHTIITLTLVMATQVHENKIFNPLPLDR